MIKMLKNKKKYLVLLDILIINSQKEVINLKRIYKNLKNYFS